MRERGEDKLWKIEMGTGEYVYEFYLVSAQKPIFTIETAFGKFRRKFSFFDESHLSAKQPIFFISPGQEATAQQTREMHGFNVQELTPRHIVLSIQNSHGKSLYEIALFSKKNKNFFKKEYILASTKKEALHYSDKFRPAYRIKITKTKKMDCYPLVRVTEEKIILDRAT